MNLIPKFLIIIVLIGLGTFANAGDVELAYTDYRQAHNAGDEDETSETLAQLKATCNKICGGLKCKNKTVASKCEIYCPYSVACSTAQGVVGGRADSNARLKTLRINGQDNNGIPLTPLSKATPVAKTEEPKEEGGNSDRSEHNLPTKVVEIRIVVENPTAGAPPPHSSVTTSEPIHVAVPSAPASSSQSQAIAAAQPPVVQAPPPPTPAAPPPANACTPDDAAQGLC